MRSVSIRGRRFHTMPKVVAPVRSLTGVDGQMHAPTTSAAAFAVSVMPVTHTGQVRKLAMWRMPMP